MKINVSTYVSRDSSFESLVLLANFSLSYCLQISKKELEKSYGGLDTSARGYYSATYSRFVMMIIICTYHETLFTFYRVKV